MLVANSENAPAVREDTPIVPPLPPLKLPKLGDVSIPHLKSKATTAGLPPEIVGHLQEKGFVAAQATAAKLVSHEDEGRLTEETQQQAQAVIAQGAEQFAKKSLPLDVDTVEQQVKEIAREVTKDAVEKVVTDEAANHMAYEAQASSNARAKAVEGEAMDGHKGGHHKAHKSGHHKA